LVNVPEAVVHHGALGKRERKMKERKEDTVFDID
jgi:hypothetical protein